MYTPENITNIKRNGQLDDYIAFERDTIAKLQAASIQHDVYPDGTPGEELVSYGYLYGRLWISDTKEVVAWFVSGSWEKRWSLAAFDGNETRALAYARAALASELEKVGKRVLADKAAGVAALEAARQA